MSVNEPAATATERPSVYTVPLVTVDGRPLIVTGCEPGPLRAAMTQVSSSTPSRRMTWVVGSLAVSLVVDPGLTRAGAIGLSALISRIRSLRTVFQNVQFQAWAVSVAFQQRLMFPP